jgi:alkylation response protein AidB-like acyl-CoA dehydrogenase
MQFQLNEEQAMLKESIARFLDANCTFETRKPVIENGALDPAHWRQFAELGLLGLALPESVGGMGYGPIETALVMEEIGRVLCVEPYWAVAVLAAQTLLATGDGKAHAILEQLVAGDARPVLAHEEAESRGDLAHVRTRAEPAGEGRWRLHGEKVVVVAGNVADHLVVSARTSGQDGDAAGISLFLLDPAVAGLRKRDIRLVDNRWASHLVLEGVEVGTEALLGEQGGAFPAIELGAAHALSALCAEAVGVMERALWITRDYLKVRKQFGQTLGNFQSLQHRMSEMLIELELSRGLVHCALASLGLPDDQRRRALSLAKEHIGRSGHFVCGQSIQLHGGIGVTEEYVVGHHFKRMTMINAALGSPMHHLESAARSLQAAGHA